MPLPPTPMNPVSEHGTLRIIRGGSYLQGAYMQRSASRQARHPASRLPDVGFRCAEDG
jgi:formylglycine-generating enzyme required for sulfatase activity